MKRRRMGRMKIIAAGAMILTALFWSTHRPPVENVSTAREENARAAGSSKAQNPMADTEDEWRLRLVNRWNPLPKSWSVNVTQLRNGQSIDERCYPDLQDMMDDCRAKGLSPVICSSYRTWTRQEELFNAEVNLLKNQGYSDEKAKEKAGTAIAVPGTSEHQLGLAVDIVDSSYQSLDKGQEDTPVQKWLMKNSWKYGFILRYPNGKSDITGIIYEPWHYRYVGKEAAKEIYQSGLCLEEWLDEN